MNARNIEDLQAMLDRKRAREAEAEANAALRAVFRPAPKAVPVTPERPSVKSLVRACVAAGIGAVEGVPAARVAGREWSRDGGAQWLARAASSPSSTTSAPAIVATVMSDFIDVLSGQSAAARLFKNRCVQLSFGRAGRIAVPTIKADPSYAAFTLEGDPAPVVQGYVEPLLTLTPRKLTAIVVVTHEMLRSSNIETWMRNMLTRSVALALDTALFDANADNGARPAGLINGITALAASTAPDPTAALIADIYSLMASIEPVAFGKPALVMSATRATSATLRSYASLDPDMLFPSVALRGSHEVIAIAPDIVAMVCDEAPEIYASREPMLQMETAPVADGTLQFPTSSMFQSDSVAIFVRLPVTWGVRSAAGIAWLTVKNW